MQTDTCIAAVRPVTRGPKHHFFGYYDKCPWSRDGRYLLAMASAFMDRNPGPDDALDIGLIDLHDPAAPFQPIGTTRAWNWQQGCMLRWLSPDENGAAIYNDREGDRFVSRIYDMQTGCTRTFDHALYDIAPRGDVAAALSFERIADTRPGYGYAGLPDPHAHALHPEDDGLFIVDMTEGKRDLVFPIVEAARMGDVRPDPREKAWFNHAKFNPSGSRLLFLHRWAPAAVPGHRGFQTRLFTINADGSDPVCLLEGCGISHFDWLDDEHIGVWLFEWNADESQTGRYALVHDTTGRQTVIAPGVFPYDGHCSFSPDRRRMLTDHYPLGPKREQTLMIYDLVSQQRVDLVALAAMQAADPSMRCDLHPRWNRDGTAICVDSTHEGSRQMYIVTLPEGAER